MSPLQLGALVGGLVAAAAWCVANGLRRAPRSLDTARRRMVGASLHTASASGSSGDGRWHEALGASAGGRWAERRFGAGLSLVGLTPADAVTRVLTAAGVVLVVVLGAVAALTAMVMLPASPLWLVLAAVAATLAGWTMVRDVHSRIERRRRELRQAASDFVQLIAVGLTTDQSVEEAVRFALEVGGGGAFALIRQPLLAAPQRGVPVWEAIDEVGRAYDVRELCELAASLERQGLQGVAIADTVATLATSMRARALDQLERDADRANADLSGPTIGFVVTTIVFLAYPLAVRIGEAFGG